jgi:hypothetical protein
MEKTPHRFEQPGSEEAVSAHWDVFDRVTGFIDAAFHEVLTNSAKARMLQMMKRGLRLQYVLTLPDGACEVFAVDPQGTKVSLFVLTPDERGATKQ